MNAYMTQILVAKLFRPFSKELINWLKIRLAHKPQYLQFDYMGLEVFSLVLHHAASS